MGALLSLLASKDQVGWVWDTWLSEREETFEKLIRESSCVVRLAADGMALRES